jgi:hypothetical protein
LVINKSKQRLIALTNRKTATDAFYNDPTDENRDQYVEREAKSIKEVNSGSLLDPQTSIDEILTGAGQDLLQFVGRIVEVALADFGGPSKAGYLVTFADDFGRSIDSTYIFFPEMVASANHARMGAYRVAVLCLLTTIPTSKGNAPALMVFSIAPLSSACMAIGMTHHERRQAMAVIERHRGWLLEFLLDELRAINGLVTDGLAMEFEFAELASIAQAVSTGQLATANGRVHILIIGAPASGKKLLALCTSVLNPIDLHAQASSLTRAGFAGGATKKRGELVVQPGLVTEAHLGVLVIEDVHGLRPSQRNAVIGAMAQVMEDGRADVSTIARQTLPAETAIYLDLNRKSQLRADGSLAVGGPKAAIADVGVPLHILSRIDVIIELPNIASSATACADKMLRTSAEPDLSAQRRLRCIVALLRDRHPEVDLSTVEHEMGEALKDVLEYLPSAASADLHVSSFPRRMANSMKKLVAAFARLRDCSVAASGDVEFAAELLKQKALFVSSIAETEPSPLTQDERIAVIQEVFGGQVISPKDVMDTLGYPRRSVMRYLDSLGSKVARGQYRIPEPDGATGSLVSEQDQAGGPVRATRLASRALHEIAQISDADMSTLTAAELNELTPDQLQSLTAEQVSQVSGDVLAGVNQSPLFAFLTPAQAKALTPEQAQELLEAEGRFDDFGNIRGLRTDTREVLRTLGGKGA